MGVKELRDEEDAENKLSSGSSFCLMPTLLNGKSLQGHY